MAIYIMGGCGYIGTHLASKLLSRGIKIVVVDDQSGPNHFSQISAATYLKISLNADDSVAQLIKNFEITPPETVIHLAGFKSVEKSVISPFLFRENNLKSTTNLIKAMNQFGVKNVIFSSSAAVYGSNTTRVNEESKIQPITEYGRIKFIEEGLFRNYVDSVGGHCAILRFFNVIGAASPLYREIAGENIFPRIHKSIIENSIFHIFGNKYGTLDGTCVRDYVDVRDVITAIEKSIDLLNYSDVGILNIGSGQGTSVLEIVKSINKIRKLKFDFSDFRPGDIPKLISDSSKAKKLIDWQSNYTVDESVISSFG